MVAALVGVAVAVVLIVLLAGRGAGSRGGTDPAVRAAAAAARQEAYARAPAVPAETLIRAWKEDPARARGLYEGRALGVEGLVTNVRSLSGALTGRSHVVQLAGIEGLHVVCLFDEEEGKAVERLGGASPVVIVGMCTGLTSTGEIIYFEHCIVRSGG